MKLFDSMGWSDFFAKQIGAGETPLCVVGHHRSYYDLMKDTGEVIRGVVAGKFQGLAPRFLPSVGDWVVGEGDLSSLVRIEKVLERKTQLLRGAGNEEQCLACNMDYVFVATSANSDLNFNRLDRYLSLIWSSGAEPILLLTKMDLHAESERILQDLRDQFPFISVIGVSSLERRGLREVGALLPPGKKALLVGSSGVGKSTLSNVLIGEDKLDTGEIRESDDKGKHTTTARHFLRSQFGGWILDSPGLKVVPLIADEDGVNIQFEAIVSLQNQCRFTDCQHETEPDCAIREALEKGELEQRDWDSYQKLQKEIRALISRKDPVMQAEQKKKMKTITKFLRQKKKLKL